MGWAIGPFAILGLNGSWTNATRTPRLPVGVELKSTEADGEIAEGEAMDKYTGRSVPRKEDFRLLTGRGSYVADLRLAGMMEAAVLRSPFAHARITAMNVDPALALPGVVAAFTAEDLRGRVPPFTRTFHPTSPSIVETIELEMKPYEAPVLAEDKVVRVGDPIAVVIAEDRYKAEDAIEMIDIQFEPLPAVADPEKALTDSAPIIHPEFGDNVHARFLVRVGDVEGAFAAADHCFTERFKVARSVGVPIETRGIVAEFDEGRGELLVWTTTQRQHLLRTYLSEMLDLPEGSIRVVAPDMGGSFGGGIYSEEIFISFIAMELGMPVRWIEDRSENLLNARHSRDQIHDIQVGYNEDGKILCLKDRILVDTGAYNLFGITLSYNTAQILRGQFKVEAFEAEGINVVTNKLQITPVRGAGRPEAVFVMDRVIDLVANSLKLDPAEVRSRNLIPSDAMPYDMKMLYRDGRPIIYDSGDYPAQLDKAMTRAGYESFRAWQKEMREEGRRLGIGISSYVEGSGYGPHEGAVVRIDGSGHLVIHTGANNHGQAHETTFAQVCADALGADLTNISVRGGDTGLIPHGGGTFASRSAVTGGPAVHIAASKLRAKIEQIAGAILEASVNDIEIEDGLIRLTGAPDRSITFRDVAAAAAPGSGFSLPEGLEPGLESESYFVLPSIAYSSGTHIAVTEVDEATGFVKIIKYVVVHDCGKMINPAVVEGQVMGGVAHGVGNAFYEEVPFNEDAQPLASTFMDYLLPTAMEVPSVEIEHQEFVSPLNPIGVKGCGEGGSVSPPAAVANSIVDALYPLDVRLNEFPMTPDRVYHAILDAKARAQSRDRELPV